MTDLYYLLLGIFGIWLFFKIMKFLTKSILKVIVILFVIYGITQYLL